MRSGIRESDWKKFRKLHPILLERFSHQILGEIRATIDGAGSSHERYLALLRQIKNRDKDVADAFNDLRRSTALEQLLMIRRMNLLTGEEFAQFSDETREFVERIISAYKS